MHSEQQLAMEIETSAAMVGLASAEDQKKSRMQQQAKKKDKVLAATVAKAFDIRKTNENNLAAKYIIKLHRVASSSTPLSSSLLKSVLHIFSTFCLMDVCPPKMNKLEGLDNVTLKRLLRCIKTGIENPDSNIGAYAMSPVRFDSNNSHAPTLFFTLAVNEVRD